MLKLTCNYIISFLLLITFSAEVRPQTPPLPDGRRLREIVKEKYPEGNLLIGGTTGQWAFGTPTGIIMDREYSYVTPENDFKQHYVHPDNNTWKWQRPDAWKNHVVANDQILRMHGPVSPQCSQWTQNDNRTPEELEVNMRAYMEELCKRYNGTPNFLYLDVVNEVVNNGSWKKNEEGVGGWEMPWFIIGQDNDKNKTPLFIKYAFQIATEHAPDISLVINQHEGTIQNNSWDLIKETIQYLRDSSLRVDGIGWQAHVDVGWEKIEGQQDALRDLIDWAHANDLDFHITECNVWVDSNGPESFKAQAETFKTIVDIVVEKSANGLVTWNTWNIDDKNAWRDERYPTLFDENYEAKPAYYAIQMALETQGDYTSKHNVKLNVKNTESGEAIPDCRVSFNNETKMTNENGEAVFEVTAGFYNGSFEKRHYETSNFSYRSVYSDTTFNVTLDSAEVIYNVIFQIEDEADGSMLTAVKVDVGEQDKTTGVEGELSFAVNPGTYTVDFSKTDFSGFQKDYTIQSDTTISVKLKRSHADVKFRLKNGSTPVNDALVIFNDDSLNTSSLGFCTFRTVPIDIEYEFSVKQEFFKTHEGIVLLEDDTTLIIQLEKTVANTEFLLTTEGATIENPFVVMNGDTAWFDENFRVKLYNIPIDAQYGFQILSGNFSTYSDELWLKGDTTVNVLIVYSSVENRSNKFFKTYPNPAQNKLYIIHHDPVSELKIIDYSGKTVKQMQTNSTKTVVDISDLNEGYYFLTGINKNNNTPETRKFIIQR